MFSTFNHMLWNPYVTEIVSLGYLWLIFCPLPALRLWLERWLVNRFLYSRTDFILDPRTRKLFLDLNAFNLQTTGLTEVWGKQRYGPCCWTKKDETLLFHFCFQDFVARICRHRGQFHIIIIRLLAGLRAWCVSCKRTSLIADFILHNALSNQWRDHFLCQWKKGW